MIAKLATDFVTKEAVSMVTKALTTRVAAYVITAGRLMA